MIKAGGSSKYPPEDYGGGYPTSNPGITDKSYPYSFEMSVDGTSHNGGGVRNAFTHLDGEWTAYASPSSIIGYYFAIMTFEKPLRIKSVDIQPNNKYGHTTVTGVECSLWGLTEDDEASKGGVFLGSLPRQSGLDPAKYRTLRVEESTYYTRYRIQAVIGGWNGIKDILLNAVYRKPTQQVSP